LANATFAVAVLIAFTIWIALTTTLHWYVVAWLIAQTGVLAYLSYGLWHGFRKALSK